MNGKALTAVQKKGAAKKPPKEQRQLNLEAMQQTPGFLVRLLQLQIFEEFFEFFAETGFSPAAHTILMIIRDNPSITQSESAALLRIQLPNLVKILTELETSDLIERKRSTIDRRAVELSLTSKGKKITGQNSRIADEFNAQCLSALSNSDREHFFRILKRLIKF